VAHLGDIGRLLTVEETALIGETDVLMVPVGGYFTVNAMQAKQIAGQLNARVILPMHYKTAYNQDWPIADETEFTALFDEKDVRRGGEVLRVTRGDLECQPKVVIL
jgi:L-ascorbate metabolism protein UlaG (beta-lactamase superfamily)